MTSEAVRPAGVTAALRLPQRLLAPTPGWTIEADVVVVGSGIAGATVALRCADLGRVLVVTKDVLAAGSTRWAQGGIAAALADDDSPAAHYADTIEAGAGLCDERAVHALVTEGPQAVRDLIALGTRFDRRADGELALTREGGHHHDRIAHAGGDATGAEIQRAIVQAVRDDARIDVIEHALVLDLLRDADGAVAGVTLHVMGEGSASGVGAVHARAVVLASGGLGQIYAATTNPPVSTGDGLAAGLRAGAVVRDLEFVQFHPTVLWLGRASKGQQPLVSEAVRGEGAFLVDDDGERFLQGEHPLADLAPRDVVAKAIMRRMRASGAEHVWLDGRHFGAERWRVRFPTILATCLEHGIDPARDLIPVAPACHYSSGGLRTDLCGRTAVPGLYACGEVAWTGVHGGNRLASNSLLEGLVFAARIADTLHGELPRRRTPAAPPGDAGLVDCETRADLQRAMTAGAGVLRSATSLAGSATALERIAARASDQPETEAWETTNLLTVAAALVEAAALRTETRGSHWREDHPERDDERWRGHVDVTCADGRVAASYQPKVVHDTPPFPAAGGGVA